MFGVLQLGDQWQEVMDVATSLEVHHEAAVLTNGPFLAICLYGHSPIVGQHLPTRLRSSICCRLWQLHNQL